MTSVPQVYSKEVKLRRLLAMAAELEFDPSQTMTVGMQDYAFACMVTNSYYPDVRLFGLKLEPRI